VPQVLHQCPIFKLLLLEGGSLLGKCWLSVSDGEQDRYIPGADICGVASSRLPVVWLPHAVLFGEMQTAICLPLACAGRRQVAGDLHDCGALRWR
jgi:hypothetical protein